MPDFLQAVQTGSSLFDQAQRRRMAQEQMNQEAAMLPLQLTIQKQNSELNALKIEEALTSRQQFLNNTKAFTELSGFVGGALEQGKFEEAQAATIGFGLRNNMLLSDPRYKALSQQLDNLQKEREMAEYRRDQLRLRLQALEGQESYRDRTLDQKQQGLEMKAEQITAQTELQKERAGIAQANVDLRKEELEARKEEVAGRLSPIDRAGLQAEIKAIQDDVKLIGKSDEQKKQIEAVLEKYLAKGKSKAFRYTPGQRLIPK